MTALADAQAGRRAFLKVAEGAQIMGVDVRTFRKGIEDNVIPAVRIGNTIRIPAAPFLALCGLTIDRTQDNGAAPAGTGTAPTMNPDQSVASSHKDTREHASAA